MKQLGQRTDAQNSSFLASKPFRKSTRLLSLGTVVLCVWGAACTSAPHPEVDFAFADAALKHAARHKADRLAPQLFRKAEKYLIKGKREYKEQYFAEAKESFSLAVKYAKLSMRKAFIGAETDKDFGF